MRKGQFAGTTKGAEKGRPAGNAGRPKHARGVSTDTTVSCHGCGDDFMTSFEALDRWFTSHRPLLCDKCIDKESPRGIS